MKKIQIFLAVVLLATVSVAQAPFRLRTVVFADTQDEKIGKGVEKQLANFDMLCDEISAAIDIPRTYEEFSGDKCSKEYLMKWVRSFNCAENDIVLFAYFGHGGRSIQDTSLFPQMCLGTNIESEWASLEALKDAIMERNPRFCMVLADCCNNFGYNVSPKFVLMNAAGSSNIEEPQSDNMKKLFLEQKGSLTISASRAGEYSFVNIDPRSPYAGVFFDSFRQNLAVYTNEATSQCNWSTLLKRIYDHVSGIDIPFNGRLWKQHPVYRIETEKKSRPKTDDNVVDIPDSKIKSQLEWIGDDRNDLSRRISESKSVLGTYFASNAVVKVVGRDRQTAILTTPASNYLSRLSTLKRLRKITIFQEEKDASGKITRLVVHETYVQKNQ